MSTRALIPCADLRRWAKVAREEGVTIDGRRDPDGGVSIRIVPNSQAAEADRANDFAERVTAWARKK